MRLTRAFALAGLVVLALVGAAAAGMVAHAGARTKTITVTEKEFRIHLSTTKIPSGTVRFVVENTGSYRHALEIAGPGVKNKRTPLIRPGKSARLVVKVSPGTYRLWYPVPGHAAQGMKAKLTVPGKGASSTPVPTTTEQAPTTTSGGYGY